MKPVRALPRLMKLIHLNLLGCAPLFAAPNLPIQEEEPASSVERSLRLSGIHFVAECGAPSAG